MKEEESRGAPRGYFPYPKEWLDAESEGIAESVKRWADLELIGKRLQFRENFEHQMKSFKVLAADMGLHGLIWPVDLGGTGFPLPGASSTLVRVYEEIGRAEPGIGYVSAVNVALAAALLEEEAADDELKARVAPAFCGDGDIQLFSLVLPGLGTAGGEPRTILSGREVQAVVRGDGDGWLLSAEGARPINSGYNASVYAVIASTPDGLGIAFVDADAEGVERGELLKTTGLSVSLNADVTFNRVRLAKNAVVPIRSGFFRNLSAWIRLLAAAVAIGSAMDVYAIVRDWADNRIIKGKGLLRDNPMDAAVLAQVAMDIVESRSLVHSLARAVAIPGGFGIETSEDLYIMSGILSVRVLENCMHAVNRAMELMASAGYAREWHVEKHWRDLKTMQVYIGGRTPVEMEVAGYYFGSDII